MRLKPEIIPACPSQSLATDYTAMLKVHPSLKRFMGYSLMKAAIHMKARLADKLSVYRIIPAQYAIVRLLEESGPMNQVSLGDSMGIDKATMVKLIDGLEALKYLKRTTSDEDRRAKLISLTDKGTNVLAKLNQACLEAEDVFLAPLSASERKTFAAMLSKLLSPKD